MKKIAVIILLFTLFSACSKQENPALKSLPETVTGTWVMTEMRADPGDGSGRFRPVDISATITFSTDGKYTDTRNTYFNRFEMIASDTVRLFNNSTTDSRLLAIQAFTQSELIYYCNWPWCGGPYGEKFKRVR